jgi:hypothetical protein
VARFDNLFYLPAPLCREVLHNSVNQSLFQYAGPIVGTIGYLYLK